MEGVISFFNKPRSFKDGNKPNFKQTVYSYQERTLRWVDSSLRERIKLEDIQSGSTGVAKNALNSAVGSVQRRQGVQGQGYIEEID